MIFFFTGTGNSHFVAASLAKSLGERLVYMPQAMAAGTMRFTLAAGESVGWVFPTYSWGPAPIAVKFAQEVQIDGVDAGTYMYMVASCGDELGLTADMWRATMAKRGWQCRLAMSVQMPNNYILLPGFDVDPKELENSKRQAAVGRVEHVAEQIKARSTKDDIVVGPMAWMKSKLVYPLFKHFYMSDRQFVAQDELCTRCGACARMFCPNQNITMTAKDGRPEWQGACAMCLSCIHRCPNKAIQFGKMTQSKGRYHF